MITKDIKSLENKLGLDDLSQGISIYYDVCGLFSKNIMNDCDRIDDKNNIENTDIDDINDIYSYNCNTCYFNCNGICSVKNISVMEMEFQNDTDDCWFYRDGLTMRASSDFQDDYGDNY